MKKSEELLIQLRESAVGAPWSNELRHFLVKCNCYGFVDNPVFEGDSVSEVLYDLIIKKRMQTGACIFQSMNEHGIPYAVVKGAVLSKRIYGRTTRRVSGDIDILIPRKYIDKVKRLFLQQGFVQGHLLDNKIVPYTRKEIIYYTAHSHQIAPFIGVTGNLLCPYVNYDLNIELFWGESGYNTDMELFLDDTIPTCIGGVNVQCLPVEKEFTALCLHHYKDWNSIYLLNERGVSLSHFFDILGYLQAQKPNVQQLRSISDTFFATEYVYFCLWYTYCLLEHPVLLPYLNAMRTPGGVALENHYGLQAIDRRGWEISLADRIFSSEFKMLFSKYLSEKDKMIIEINKTMV